MTKLGAICLAIAMAFLISACEPGTGAKTAGAKSTKKKVERKQLEFKGEKGKLVVEEAGKSLPEGFPTDMPIYKPSRVKSTVSSEGAEEATMTMAILETRADVASVAAFYQSDLPAQGWTINNVVSVDQTASTFAVNKVNQAGTISIGADRDTSSTIISINVALR